MSRVIVLSLFAGSLLLVGCISSNTPEPKKDVAVAKDPEDGIRAALDKLDPEDRAVARAQKWCAVEHENRLGEMGKPFKVMVKGQPVFLCCKGCQKEALVDPDKTLAVVAELKSKAAEKTP